MHAMLADDSGHLDLDLDDSDADPDFVPEKKKKKSFEDDDDTVLPSLCHMVASKASCNEHDQGAQEIGDTREKRKRKSATERSKERTEKQKEKITKLQRKT